MNKKYTIEQPFVKQIVFGSMPIGNPKDISLNFLQHVTHADIILTERVHALIRVMDAAQGLYDSSKFNISHTADIYQYQVENYKERETHINNVLLDEIDRGKKIFVISDEGSSLFLEPMSSFKDELVARGIDFQVLPGPNSVISAITSTRVNVLDFCFGGNYEWIDQERKYQIFNHINNLKMPTVFILRAQGLLDYLLELKDNFNKSWIADLGLNLSMDDEQHIVGPLSKIYDEVKNTTWIWQNEEDNKKIIITLFPNTETQP